MMGSIVNNNWFQMVKIHIQFKFDCVLFALLYFNDLISQQYYFNDLTIYFILNKSTILQE
jgi:hypothetical protein